MRSNSIVYDKAFKFAVRIVNFYKYLSIEKHEFVLSKQLLRSGTSIGANISEALEGQSTKDFIAKLQISLKEANESRYWINLLKETDYIDEKIYNQLLSEIEEIIKILISILKTSKAKIVAS